MFGTTTGRGRIEQRLSAREHEDDEPHHCDLAAAHRDGDREHRDDHCAQRVHADHHAPPVVAVRDNATEDTDEEEREPAGDLRPRDEDRRVGEVGGQEGECRECNPVPQERGGRCQPECVEPPAKTAFHEPETNDSETLRHVFDGE